MKYWMDWNNYSIYRCVDCQLEATIPLPTHAALYEYYQGADGRDMAKSERWFERVDRAVVYYFERFAEITSEAAPRRMLDLGGGVGYWSAVAQARGVDVCLMDFADDALQFARERLGVKWTVAGDIGRSSDYFSEAEFDFVLARHTIEHMIDPEAYLAHVAKVIRPGGVLELETPNVLGREQFAHPATVLSNYRVIRRSNPQMGAAKARAIAWNKALSGVNPPKHLWGFTLKSLRLMLERQGFDIREVRTEPAGHPELDPLYYDVHGLRTRRGFGVPYYFWERAATAMLRGRGQNLALLAVRR